MKLLLISGKERRRTKRQLSYKYRYLGLTTYEQIEILLLKRALTASSIGRNDANTEGRKPLYRVYKVGPVKLYYTVESILRL